MNNKLKIYLRSIKDNSWQLFEGTLESLQKELEKRNIKISLEAKMGLSIKIGNRASVGNGASVGDGASVGNRASVVKNAKLQKSMKDDIIQYIAKTLNIYPIESKYIFYKRVNKISNPELQEEPL